MWFNLAVSFVFLFFFRGWGTLAAVISVATIISYLTGPVSVMTLRRTAPELHRPFRLPGLPVHRAARVRLLDRAAVLGEVAADRRDHPADGRRAAGLLLLPGKSGWHDFGRQLAGAWWLVAYLPVIALVSWTGSKQFGGKRSDPVRLGSGRGRGDRRRVLFLGRCSRAGARRRSRRRMARFRRSIRTALCPRTSRGNSRRGSAQAAAPLRQTTRS